MRRYECHEFIDQIHLLNSNVKGRLLEEACVWLLSQQTVFPQLSAVWPWQAWPGRRGPDVGIDIVAQAGDAYWAVQVKCYSPNAALRKAELDSFLSASSTKDYARRLLIVTTDRLGPNAQRTIQGQEKPVDVLTLSDLCDLPLKWPEAVVSRSEVFLEMPGNGRSSAESATVERLS